MNKSSDTTFEELGVAPQFVEMLLSQTIVAPTAIQRLAIPRILGGETLVVKSQTGSGKSLAYLLPLLQCLVDDGSRRALILLPTRELVLQVTRVVTSIITTLPIATIYGGVEYALQRETLAAAPRLVIATPGRLEDFISQGVEGLSGFDSFVLDEVDQMVDLGFREVIERLSALRAATAQTLCFSATLSQSVKEVVESVVGQVELVEDRAAPLAAQQIVQSVYYVEQSMMDHLLLHLLRTKQPTRAILFCRSRKMADRLSELLRANSFSAEAIHSERSQAAREYILQRFHDAETTLLVATDLMARGIDVDGVSHVFNFGLPQSPDQYIHRIGRTGRAGASGEAITMLCADERKLLDATCSTMRQHIAVNYAHPYMTPAITSALSQGSKPKSKSKRRGSR
ncbi:MAG: DEAD/DEAH box helicase [Rikenellaceae bacterium]